MAGVIICLQPGPSTKGHPGPRSPGPDVPSWYLRSSTAKKSTFIFRVAAEDAGATCASSVSSSSLGRRGAIGTVTHQQV